MISGFPYLLAEMNKVPQLLPESLRLLISGGDVLRAKYISKLKDKVMIYNTYGPSETPSAPATSGPITPSRYADKFKSLVADHFRTAYSTEYYADRLFITPNYLDRLIRSTLGKSAKEYIMGVVFDESCRLLRFTDMTVEEISERLGFETSTYFIRSFGKRFSVTPLQYR